MKKTLVALAASTFVVAACNDATTSPAAVDADALFGSALAGYGEVNSSFVAGEGGPQAFVPGMGNNGLMGPRGPRRGPGPMGGMGGGVMGGGLDLAFAGGIAAGRGPHAGPFGFPFNGDNCSFANGDVTCALTRAGVDITRIYTWKKQDGTAQQRPDSTTFSARVRTSASGTLSRQNVTTTIDHASDRTVTGLSSGSTQRTVDGWSAGTESTTGTNREGKTFTSQRVAGDTVTNVIVPVQDGGPTYPVAGTVVRSMSATMTVDGTATTRSRREVITYNGTATASVVITVNGETRTCSLPLPRGRLNCD